MSTFTAPVSYRSLGHHLTCTQDMMTRGLRPSSTCEAEDSAGTMDQQQAELDRHYRMIESQQSKQRDLHTAGEPYSSWRSSQPLDPSATQPQPSFLEHRPYLLPRYRDDKVHPGTFGSVHKEELHLGPFGSVNKEKLHPGPFGHKEKLHPGPFGHKEELHPGPFGSVNKEKLHPGLFGHKEELHPGPFGSVYKDKLHACNWIQRQEQLREDQGEQSQQDQQYRAHNTDKFMLPERSLQSERGIFVDPSHDSSAESAASVSTHSGISHNGHDCNDVPAVMDRSDKPMKPIDLAFYTQPFLSFISENPTVFHAVACVAKRLESRGFEKLSERDSWSGKLTRGGRYFFERNGSSVIAFVVGDRYESGNGASVIASHIDALTTRLKPIPTLATKAGYVQLGVAPYAGALNNTWWDRDLGIGGRVLVKDGKTGKINSKLMKLDWPIARIPTLAPHFGAAADLSHPNKETEMVPIIGLESASTNQDSSDKSQRSSLLGGAGSFTATQPERLVKAIAEEMNIKDYRTIINWELELFDTQPAQLGGLDKEFIFAGRVDDKLCSFAAIEALIASSETSGSDSGAIKIVGCFDDEEIGSLLRQGAHSNLLPSTLERICEAFAKDKCGANLMSQMYANSFLISADVSHAVNPNFMGSYLENHSPRLNTGVAVQADPNGHTTTDSLSTAFLQRVADKCNAKLQVFQIRNDSRSGGTVGPMLSSAMGMRAIDAGLPQLSMHSIRATIGSLDPGLGVQLFKGFFDYFEEVDAEFQ